MYQEGRITTPKSKRLLKSKDLPSHIPIRPQGKKGEMAGKGYSQEEGRVREDLAFAA